MKLSDLTVGVSLDTPFRRSLRNLAPQIASNLLLTFIPDLTAGFSAVRDKKYFFAYCTCSSP